MTVALTTFDVLLAGVLGALLLLQFAIIRRLRFIEAKLQTLDEPFPQLGTRVDAFEIETRAGRRVTGADLSVGSRVIIVVEPGCEACTRLTRELRSGTSLQEPLVLVLTADDDAEATALADSLRDVAEVAVVPEDSPAIDALGGVTAFPTLLRIEDGEVRAVGHRVADVVPPIVRA